MMRFSTWAVMEVVRCVCVNVGSEGNSVMVLLCAVIEFGMVLKQRSRILPHQPFAWTRCVE